MRYYRTIQVSDGGMVMEGDRVLFTMQDGEEVEAFCVKAEEGGSGLFIFTDCLKKEYRLHQPGKYPGWERSELREKLNGEILERFPAEIREHLVPFKNGDMLRIPTEREIFWENEWSMEGEEPETARQFNVMKERRARIAFRGLRTGIWEWYWLQNRGVSSATYACYVDNGGYADNSGASASRGVRPLFRYR